MCVANSVCGYALINKKIRENSCRLSPYSSKHYTCEINHKVETINAVTEDSELKKNIFQNFGQGQS